MRGKFDPAYRIAHCAAVTVDGITTKRIGRREMSYGRRNMDRNGIRMDDGRGGGIGLCDRRGGYQQERESEKEVFGHGYKFRVSC